ncbi:MAG: hypothetical protein KKB38_20135 [Gammaproteobacteria bacterium]|nr:hypothetical protein [Gammaproteobacteria bacterium]
MKIPLRTTKIKLSGDYEGGEVEVKLNPPVGPLLDAIERFQKANKAEVGEVIPAVWDMVEQLIVSWNFETQDGKDIPVSIEGIRTLPAELVIEIATKTQEAAGSLPKVSRENSDTP